MRTPGSRNMPWWSSELCAASSKVRKAYKLWSLIKSDENRSSYSRLKATYQRALRLAKYSSYKSFQANSSTPDVFKSLKSFAGKTKTIPFPDSLLVNGHVLTDPLSINKACANHFFLNPTTSLPEHDLIEKEAVAFLNNPLLEAPPPISDWELETAIRSLNPDSGAGCDGISSSLLLAALPVLKAHVRSILDSCLSLCYFPDQWKVVKVAIIGKVNKQSYDSLQSFRPISLGSNLSKLLEKIILGRLSWFSSTHSWLSSNQHGFREGKSTESAAHSLVSPIETGFAARQNSACAFLDIKSAFDSVWHTAIIAALVKRSCPLYLLKIVGNFLADRTALLSHRGVNFRKSLSLGCPQGGVMSPFLWIILIDDVLRQQFRQQFFWTLRDNQRYDVYLRHPAQLKS